MTDGGVDACGDLAATGGTIDLEQHAQVGVAA
jgi:hypothetical protein